jgi:serine-type D-Ala-D-Ala carboxypeptidase/endopeptidase (penicillin-binding protein 4)
MLVSSYNRAVSNRPPHDATSTPRRGYTRVAVLLVAFALAGAAVFSQPGRHAFPPFSSSARAGANSGVKRFRARVEKALAAPAAQQSFWGLLVADAETGEVLYELNADRHFHPASTAKLFATSLALARLGPEFRFHNTLEAEGALDVGGELHGDLVLVGRGDPNLSNRKFPYVEQVEREGSADTVLAEMAAAAIAKGLREVDGDIIADDSYFSYERYPSGWELEDLKYGFGAPVSAIAVNDNTFFVEIGPGEHAGEPTSLSEEPWAADYNFLDHIVTAAPHTEAKIHVTWEPGSHQIDLQGEIPAGAEPVKLTLALPEPAEYAAQLLKRLLEQRGVKVQGQARARHSEDSAASPAGAPTILAEHISVPLADVIRAVNKTSENLHAEMLMRTVARVETGIGSLENGLKVEAEFLKTAGIPEDDVFLTDGSGLSRRNLVTPRAMVALLRYIARQPWSDALVSSLPVAGKDGTLARQMKDSAAAGRIFAKTGSLEHAKALAGYATTLSGRRLVFAILGDNYTVHAAEANSIIDGIAIAMVEEISSPRKK